MQRTLRRRCRTSRGWRATCRRTPGIREWGVEPIALDVSGAWPSIDADAAFTANTCHILSWPQVEKMFAGVGAIATLRTFCVYGPFNYGGRFTSDSNQRFDAMLRARDSASGLRDCEAIVALAKRQGLALQEDNRMPANNRLLVFER